MLESLPGLEMFLKHLFLRKISKFLLYNIVLLSFFLLFLTNIFNRDLKHEVFQKLLNDSVGITPTEKKLIESSTAVRGKFEDFLQCCWRNWKSNEKR